MRSHVKRVVPPAQRAWLRSAAGGNPYRHERGTEPVRIGDIVSPLRYDVLLRARHFAWHAEHRELMTSDPDAYQDLARRQAYFIWFSRVMVPRWLPTAQTDAVLFESAWRERLQGSAALFESFQQEGFDTSHPVELHAGLRVRRSRSGKLTSRRLFAGDGNHRLSLLMAAGHQVLVPDQYMVKRYLFLVPADTTGLLLRETGADLTEYRSFVTLGYPGTRLDDPDGGRVRVDAATDAVASEVAGVAKVDLPNVDRGRA